MSGGMRKEKSGGKKYVMLGPYALRNIAKCAWEAAKAESEDVEDDLCLYYGEGGVMLKPSCAYAYPLEDCGKECDGWETEPF